MRSSTQDERQHYTAAYRASLCLARAPPQIKSAFRPSDDATVYRFHVPANAMAAVYLNRTATLLSRLGEQSLASEAMDLAGDVTVALRAHAVVAHPVYGEVYAYEVVRVPHSVYVCVRRCVAVRLCGCVAVRASV